MSSSTDTHPSLTSQSSLISLTSKKLHDRSISLNSSKSSSNINNNLNVNFESTFNDYSLADIYEDAAVIGSELEKIINNYGADVLKDLMPKVINVLELLEHLTIRNEKENDELAELRLRVHLLEAEKTQRNNSKDKFEKELEEIEDKWKQETLKLIGMVNKLKDENKRLNNSIDLNSSDQLRHNDQLVIKQEELDYIRQIKEENIKLKEAVRFKDRELEQKNNENEGLQSQIDSLSNTMLNFRRKQILAQNQIEKMVKIKSELECSLTEKEHQLNKIKEKLLIKNISDDSYASLMDESLTSNEIAQHQTKLAEPQTKLIQIDPKDPNRPRFTLKELEKVLIEKNELTIKLDQTQDELEQLRKQELSYGGEVQGPINKEPDEKLDPTKQTNISQASTGIRRLYVVDSNNNFIIVVFNLQINDLLCSIANFFSLSNENDNNNIFTSTSCKCFSEECNQSGLPNTISSNDQNSSSIGQLDENTDKCSKSKSVVLSDNPCTTLFENYVSMSKHIYFIILMINIIYLFMCFDVNKVFTLLFKIIYYLIKWDSCFLFVYLLLLSLPFINLSQFRITSLSLIGKKFFTTKFNRSRVRKKRIYN